MHSDINVKYIQRFSIYVMRCWASLKLSYLLQSQIQT